MPSKDFWKGVKIVLPTLNEREGLKLVLDDFKKLGLDMGSVIVVDGHSTDGTVELAKEYGANVILQEGRGKGNGFRSFLKKWEIKDNELYVMLDADYTYLPEDAVKMVEKLREGYDVVIGNRKLFVRDLRSLVHTFGNIFLSFLGSLLFLAFNPDICTGYWGFRGSALKKIEINAAGFDLEANLWAEVRKKRLKYALVRVGYRSRVGEAKLGIRDGFVIAKRLIAERFGRAYKDSK